MTTEVRKGYKQTEIGVIPEDWEVKRLGELGKFSKGQGVRKDEALSGDIPCVRYGELYTRHSDYIKQFYSFISKEISETAKKIKTGDILFAGSGETKEEIGKCVAFVDEIEAYVGGDVVILSPFIVESLYLGYLLNAPMIQKQKASRGQGDAVVHISSSQLSNIIVPLPPTKSEQTAIATALSDADALITSLEKLIEKKRAIKQGAMQELLRPKEGWEIKPIGEIAPLQRGFDLPNRDLQQGTYPVVYSNGIVNYHNKFQVKAPGIVTGRSGTIGKVTYVEDDYWPHNTALWVTDFKGNSPRFIYYLFLKIKLDRFATGSGVPTLNRNDVHDFRLAIPKFEEQTRIATILSDMDAEIIKLEQKPSKYKQLKKGMMQELLTGKIRLI